MFGANLPSSQLDGGRMYTSSRSGSSRPMSRRCARVCVCACVRSCVCVCMLVCVCVCVALFYVEFCCWHARGHIPALRGWQRAAPFRACLRRCPIHLSLRATRPAGRYCITEDIAYAGGHASPASCRCGLASQDPASARPTFQASPRTTCCRTQSQARASCCK